MLVGRLRITLGVLVLVLLGTMVDGIQAAPLPNSDLGGLWLSDASSHRSSILAQRPAHWSWRTIVLDKSLGFNRPGGATLRTLDPDFSAAYAVGGGFDWILNPQTALSTSVQFLWTKIDNAGQRIVGPHRGNSDLSEFNIRAVNLVIGLTTRF
jgi:hypothetical protein